MLHRKLQRKGVKALLKIPTNFEVIVMVGIGYAKEKRGLSSKLLDIVRTKKPLSGVASEEEFGKPFVTKKI